jgi:hypothetical protein
MANQRRVDPDHDGKEQADEQTPELGSRADTFFPSTAFGPVIGRWLDLVERADPVRDPATRQARRICGRWIGRRRVRLGLSETALTAVTELDAATQELLELGLAGDDIVVEPCQERLVLALTGDELDADWVHAVVEVALGRREAHAQAIADQAALALSKMTS